MRHPARHRHLHRLAALTMAAGLLVGAAACSSSDGSDGGSSAKTTTTAKASGGSKGAGSTTSTTRPDPADIEGSASDYRQALIDSYKPENAPFTKNQAQCLAPKWVEAIGVDTFKEAGIPPADVAKGSKSLDDIGITKAMAEAMVAAMHGCDIDTLALLVQVTTGGAKLSPAQQSCFEEAVTPEELDAFLVSLYTGEEPDNAQLLESVKGCATKN